MRRRVGTAFKLDDLFPYDEVSTDILFVLLPLLFHCVCLPRGHLDQLTFLMRLKSLAFVFEAYIA